MARRVVYARHGGPEVLEVVEAEISEPGPGHVRVQAAGLNPVDWKTFRGGGGYGIPLPGQ